MLKKLSLLSLTLLLPLMVSAQNVCTFTTTKTLKRGDTHQDILIMQRVLNMDATTLIAKTGSGSPGKENTYFGTLTYNALRKFQSKYAITVEKGALGTVTRTKLSTVCATGTTLTKPINTSLPTISSVTNTTSLTLTASTGAWSGTPTSYSYRWLRNGTNITNATLATYTTTVADNNATISVRVTATNKLGSVSATSAGLRVVNPVVVSTPVNTALPVISVTSPTTLSTTNGSWSNTPTAYTYQWKRNGVSITGATASTYATSTQDAGTTLTVTVTASNSAGSVSATSLGKTIATLPVVTPTNNTLSLTTTSGLGYITGTGITTCTSSCTSSIASGTVVTLTAVAVTGNTFTGWSGACSATTTTCVVTMSSAKSVGATFVVTPVVSTAATNTLTITSPSNGTITGTGINCGTTCSTSVASGTSLTLTATPATGYSFTSWSGACSGTASTCTVTMSSIKSVGATFTVIPVVSTAGLPELPRVYIDTTYVAPSGTVLRPADSAAFQAALDSVQPGQVIELTAGATYTGNFRIKPKSGSAMIHIRSSRYAELPVNTRVTPAQANLMAKIVSPNSDPALDFVFDGTSGASNYRVIGLEVTNGAGYMYRLVNTGYNYLTGLQPTQTSQLSNNIILDRMYIHGNGNGSVRSGVVMNTAAMALIDSYVSEIYQPGSDSQATMAWNGTGPLKIVNNYLEAGSENIMFGGSDAAIPNSIISDIEIRGNHVYKPLTWIKAGLNVKNLLEFKQGQRALIEGNIFENNFADGQSGFAFLITPRNQDGRMNWSKVQDVTVRNNKFINVGAGMNFSGRDGNHPEMYDNPTYGTSLVSKRILVENNVVTITGINYSDNRAYQVLGGPENLTIRHNTTFWTPGLNNIGYGAAVMSESTPKASYFTFENNIQDWNYYGIIGGGTGNINTTLATWFEPNAVVNKNVFIGGSAGTTSPPAINNFFPANYAAVGFTNQAGGDYTLTSGSVYKNAASDGTDIGINMPALSAALSRTAISPSARVTPATYGLQMDVSGGSVSGAGIATCSGSCLPSVTASTTITLTATPATGKTFAGWGYACADAGTNPTCTITMNSLKYVTASFR